MRKGKHWVHMEIFEGSYGGRGGLDGMDAVDTLYANTRNNPIEDIESHLPLRVSRYDRGAAIAQIGELAHRAEAAAPLSRPANTLAQCARGTRRVVSARRA
jgi:hypothetical protein